jgi:hypothetical protein
MKWIAPDIVTPPFYWKDLRLYFTNWKRLVIKKGWPDEKKQDTDQTGRISALYIENFPFKVN